MNVSDSESDSDDSLIRLGAVSPKIRTRMSSNYQAYCTGIKSQNELLIKSCLQQSEENPCNTNSISQANKFTGAESENNTIPYQKGLINDSDDSDEEISVIEKGIQMSLEQVTNRLRGYNQNNYSTYRPTLSGYNTNLV